MLLSPLDEFFSMPKYKIRCCVAGSMNAAAYPFWMSPLSVTLFALTHAQPVLMLSVSLLPFVYVVVSAFEPGKKSRANPALRKLAGNGERGTPTPLLTVHMLFDPDDAPQSGGVDAG